MIKKIITRIKKWLFKRKMARMTDFDKARRSLKVIKSKQAILRTRRKKLKNAIRSDKKALAILEQQRIAISRAFGLFENDGRKR